MGTLVTMTMALAMAGASRTSGTLKISCHKCLNNLGRILRGDTCNDFYACLIQELNCPGTDASANYMANPKLLEPSWKDSRLVGWRGFNGTPLYGAIFYLYNCKLRGMAEMAAKKPVFHWNCYFHDFSSSLAFSSFFFKTICWVTLITFWHNFSKASAV